MENKHMKFIITTDKDSADLLLKSGFQLVNQSLSQWTFLNEGKMLFHNLKNITYTNKLFI